MINWNINISETTLAARAKKVQTTLNEHRARHLDALLKNADSISPAMRAKAIAARNYLWMSLLKTVDVGLPVTDPNDDTKAEDLPHDLRPGYRRLSQPIEIKVDFDLTEGAVKLAEERGISERRLRAGIAYRLMQCFDTKPNSIPVQIANRDSTAMLTPFKDRFRKAANLNRDHITVGDLVLASAIGPLFAKAIGMELQRVTYVGGLYRAFEKASEGVSWTQLIEDVLQGGNPPLVIAGLPRTGKTFTAYRLLYSIFCAGGSVHRIASRIDSSLKKIMKEASDSEVGNGNRWYFFDDPFGTTDWEYNVTATDIHGCLETMRSCGNTMLTIREGLLERYLKDASRPKNPSRESEDVRARYITKWDSARRNGPKNSERYMEPYSLPNLVGMVLDYAALAGAEWAMKPNAFEKVAKKVKDYNRLMPADISVISNDATSVSDRDEFLQRIKNAAVTVAGLADDIPFIFGREMRVAFMLPTILRLNTENGTKMAQLLGVSSYWSAATNHAPDSDPQIGTVGNSIINKYLRILHPAYQDCFALYSRRSRGIEDLTNRREFLFEKSTTDCWDSQTFVFIADLIRFRMMCELRRFRDLVEDDEVPNGGLKKWLSQQLFLQKAIDRSNTEGRERLRVVYDEFSRLEEFVHREFPSRESLVNIEDLPADSSECLLRKPSGTRDLKFLTRPASVSATGFVLQDILRLCLESDPLSIIDGSGIDSFIDTLLSQCTSDDFTPFQVALCISTIVGGIASPWGEQPVADEAITKWIGKLSNIDVSKIGGQICLLTLADILVWKISDFSVYIKSPRRKTLVPRDLGFDEIVQEPPDPEYVKKLLRRSEHLLAETLGKLQHAGEDLIEYSRGWMLFTLLWHNDWIQWPDSNSDLKKLWEKCLNEWDRTGVSSAGRLSQMQRGFFDNAE